MEARPQTIQQVFDNGGYIQYVLPHFQREYTWDTEDCQTLLADAYATYIELVGGAREPEHFMGSLVRVDKGTRHGIKTYTLVDGQQRLTTISLLLSAILVVMRETDPHAAKRIWRMLVNPDEAETAASRYKLVPTTKHNDRVAYIAMLTETPKADNDSKIVAAYQHLLTYVREKVATGEVDAQKFCDTILECFQVVTIDLKSDEQPYKIFESLNGKGKPLTPADLVRNYVAMTLPPEMQEEVFTKHWEFIDAALAEKRDVGSSRYGELTGFLRHYLAMRTGNLTDREHIYERFRDRMKPLAPEAFAAEIATLRQFAEYYDRLLRPNHEPNLAVRDALTRLQTFEMSTAFPFLMRAYDARDRGEITSEQFLDVLKVLENYAVRRFLCGRQANVLNKMFPLLWGDIDLDNFSASLRERLASRQYPRDEEVRQGVHTRKVYSPSNGERLVFIYRVVNRHLSAGSGGYTVLDADPTLEHILPQSPNEAWKAELGETWEETYANYVHTLGNLTPVTMEWNAALSNRPFDEKRERLRANGLRINSEYFAREIAQWDEAAILARADWLTDKILAIWPAISTPLLKQTPAFTLAPKPVTVTISGQTFPVSHWSAVLEQTTAVVAARMGDDFTAIAEKFPQLFVRKKPSVNRGPYELPDGWWLCSYWGSKNIKKHCRDVILAADLSESDWNVEEAGDRPTDSLKQASAIRPLSIFNTFLATCAGTREWVSRTALVATLPDPDVSWQKSLLVLVQRGLVEQIIDAEIEPHGQHFAYRCTDAGREAAAKLPGVVVA